MQNICIAFSVAYWYSFTSCSLKFTVTCNNFGTIQVFRRDNPKRAMFNVTYQHTLKYIWDTFSQGSVIYCYNLKCTMASQDTIYVFYQACGNDNSVTTMRKCIILTFVSWVSYFTTSCSHNIFIPITSWVCVPAFICKRKYFSICYKVYTRD